MLTSETDFSQYGEQKIIFDFFNNTKLSYVAYCVDAGAFDGVVGSNSRGLFLAGWRGIAIEPNPRSFARLSALYAERPDVTCVQKALSDRRAEVRPMRFSVGPQGVPEADKWMYGQVSTLHDAWAAHYERGHSYVFETHPVEIDTLTGVMRESGVPADLGFVSIDCEGEDLAITKELDLSFFQPRLICVECDTDRLPTYTELLEQRGYAFHARTVANTFFTIRH